MDDYLQDSLKHCIDVMHMEKMYVKKTFNSQLLNYFKSLSFEGKGGIC